MSDISLFEKIYAALRGRTFFADVSVNCRKINVRIEYAPPSEMIVSGLKPDYPPHIWFRDGIVKVSYEKKIWKTIETDSGIQILRLLDPRLLLTPIRPPIIREIRRFRFGFAGKYDIKYLNELGELKLPRELISWMVEKSN